MKNTGAGEQCFGLFRDGISHRRHTGRSRGWGDSQRYSSFCSCPHVSGKLKQMHSGLVSSSTLPASRVASPLLIAARNDSWSTATGPGSAAARGVASWVPPALVCPARSAVERADEPEHQPHVDADGPREFLRPGELVHEAAARAVEVDRDEVAVAV